MKRNLGFVTNVALWVCATAVVLGAGTAVLADCELDKLVASDGATSDKLGTAVAVFGDTAVVGAYYNDDNGNNSGSAYVFRFDGSDWIQQAKLTAADAAADDHFGYAVGIWADTVVVGAPDDDDAGSKSGSVYVFRFNGTSWVPEQKLTALDAATGDFFGTSVAISGGTVVVGSPDDDDAGSMSGSAYVFRFDGLHWFQQAKLLALDDAAGDEFGGAVGVFGDVAVVGSANDVANAVKSGSAYVFRFDGANWLQEDKLIAADAAWADCFGTSVSLWGDCAVIGAYLDDDMGNNSGSAYVFRFDGSTWAPQAKLTAADGAVGDNFAKSVAVWGDTVVVGADLHDVFGYNSGSAYVFRFTGSGWLQETKLVPSDGYADDHFGAAVAVWADTLVVGTPDDDDRGVGSGSTYIFGLEGTPWQVKLRASDGTEYDHFGGCVALSGDAAVVGAEYDDDNGIDAGSAYIYRFDGTNWFEEQKLLASDGAANDWFGYSVAVSGDTAVIGASEDDDNGSSSGSAYVFRFDGSNWNQEQKLTASDGMLGDLFGRAVAVSGEIAVVGADGDDEMGSHTGSAYVFRFNGLNWVEQAKLLASDGSDYNYFGCSVAVSGDTVAIGAYYDDDNGYASGSAYIFRFNGLNWVEQAKLLASDGSEYDRFGWSVSISGDMVVIGAYHDEDNGNNSGSAYVFRFDGLNWIQEQKLTASDGAADDRFGTSVAICGDTAVIGAYLDDDKGSVYVFNFDGASWQQRRKLSASDGEENDLFGMSAAISGDTVVVGAHYDDDNGPDSGSAYVFGLALNPGDLDRDNDVDLFDFGLLAGFWLDDDCGPCRCDRADFNRDGVCDNADLMILTANWLRGK
ncbi:MAG: FG-GAP repeat protein [Sedimentisphaerales bacterium]|nr:FG-GAP repeat protein [Sedimentisphaerales bacterium]